MFDLEPSITHWREQMLAAGIAATALEELEGHLREEITRQIQSQHTPEQAFARAVAEIGDAARIQTEFKKNKFENWRPSFAWMAWTLFAVSFFLPAYADGMGWQCAGLSLIGWLHPMNGQWDWPSIHMALLTPANLLMLVSPLLLLRFSHQLRLMTWLRWLGLLASALTWSFLILLLCYADGNDLKIGSYVWATSFILLNLATFKRSQTMEQYA